MNDWLQMALGLAGGSAIVIGFYYIQERRRHRAWCDRMDVICEALRTMPCGCHRPSGDDWQYCDRHRDEGQRPRSKELWT